MEAELLTLTEDYVTPSRLKASFESTVLMHLWQDAVANQLKLPIAMAAQKAMKTETEKVKVIC